MMSSSFNFTFSETLADVPPWIIKSGDVEGSYQLGGGTLPPELQATFTDGTAFTAAIERAALAAGFNLGQVSLISDPAAIPERQPDIGTPEQQAQVEQLAETQQAAEPGREQTPPPPADQAT